LWARREKSQLTSTKPPSTHSHDTLRNARAMGSASPDMKRNASSSVNPTIAP
jgi:hypothetical protein